MKTSSRYYQIVPIIYVNLNLRGFTHNQYDKPLAAHGQETPPSTSLPQHSNHTTVHYHYHDDMWYKQTHGLRFLKPGLMLGRWRIVLCQQVAQSHQCIISKDKHFSGWIFAKYDRLIQLIGLAVTRSDCGQMVDLYVGLYLAVIS